MEKRDRKKLNVKCTNCFKAERIKEDQNGRHFYNVRGIFYVCKHCGHDTYGI